jgi:hypothetical protein
LTERDRFPCGRQGKLAKGLIDFGHFARKEQLQGSSRLTCVHMTTTSPAFSSDPPKANGTDQTTDMHPVHHCM